MDVEHGRASDAAIPVVNHFDSVIISGGTAYVGSQRSASRSLQDVDQLRKEIIQSLAFEGEYSRYDQVRDAYPGTYEWIFSRSVNRWSSFVDWLEGNGSIYWIHGKPGSGKSTLMRFIAEDNRLTEHLATWSNGDEVAIFSHFFWRAGSPDQKNLIGLLRSLLHQALESAPELADGLLSVYKKRRGRWPLRDLTAGLRKTFESYSTHCILLIDGVDEFLGDQTEVDACLSLIKDLAGLPCLKVCVSSRPEGALRETFGDYESLRLQDLTAEDLRKYAIGRFEGIRHFQTLRRQDELEMGLFVNRLVDQAHGVFLWLYLATDDLVRGFQKNDGLAILEDRLRLLGNTLHDIFSYIMSQIEPVYTERVAGVIALLLSRPDTERPVSVLEALQRSDPQILTHVLRVPPASIDRGQCQILFQSWLESTERLTIQSGGLFELLPGRSHYWSSDIDACDSRTYASCYCLPSEMRQALFSPRLYFKKLMAHFRSMQLAFVHRSAFDYFEDHQSRAFPINAHLPLSRRASAEYVKETQARITLTLNLICASLIEQSRAWSFCWLRKSIAGLRPLASHDFRDAGDILKTDLRLLLADVHDLMGAEAMDASGKLRSSLQEFILLRVSMETSLKLMTKASQLPKLTAGELSQVSEVDSSETMYFSFFMDYFRAMTCHALPDLIEFTQTRKSTKFVSALIRLQILEPSSEIDRPVIWHALIEQIMRGVDINDLPTWHRLPYRGFGTFLRLLPFHHMQLALYSAELVQKYTLSLCRQFFKNVQMSDQVHIDMSAVTCLARRCNICLGRLSIGLHLSCIAVIEYLWPTWTAHEAAVRAALLTALPKNRSSTDQLSFIVVEVSYIWDGSSRNSDSATNTFISYYTQDLDEMQAWIGDLLQKHNDEMRQHLCQQIRRSLFRTPYLVMMPEVRFRFDELVLPPEYRESRANFEKNHF